MRAATKGLLNFEDGCLPNRRGLLRELFVLGELAREDQTRLNETMAHMKAASAQLLAKSQYQALLWEIFEDGNDRALLAYQRMGKLLCPWDDSWQLAMDKTNERIYNRDNEIGDTGFSDESIVKLIRDFEAAKSAWESKHEPRRSKSA